MGKRQALVISAELTPDAALACHSQLVTRHCFSFFPLARWLKEFESYREAPLRLLQRLAVNNARMCLETSLHCLREHTVSLTPRQSCHRTCAMTANVFYNKSFRCFRLVEQ